MVSVVGNMFRAGTLAARRGSDPVARQMALFSNDATVGWGGAGGPSPANRKQRRNRLGWPGAWNTQVPDLLHVAPFITTIRSAIDILGDLIVGHA